MPAQATATATAPLPTERTVHFVRTYDAPRDLVFRLWTEPKHMAQWWGPEGFDNPVCEIDARAGGKMLIHMRQIATGVVFPMPATFNEVVPPERLVFTAFAEIDGQRHLESLTTVLFEEIGGGKTRLTVHAAAHALSPMGPQMLAGMDAGWSGSLDKLTALVAKIS